MISPESSQIVGAGFDFPFREVQCWTPYLKQLAALDGGSFRNQLKCLRPHVIHLDEGISATESRDENSDRKLDVVKWMPVRAAAGLGRGPRGCSQDASPY